MDNELTLESTVELNNGVRMPRFGLGVWQMKTGRETLASVGHALKAGYRLIDTAKLYGNEKEVGQAVRDSGLERQDIFVTTKLWNTDHGYDRALSAFEESERRLGLGAIDLYLIHWPVEGLRGESWRALERLYKEKRVRAIGVSNYTIRHLRELLAQCEIRPAVNQVELSPFLYQRELLEFCKAQDIAVEAYCPLTRGEKLSDPRVQKIAARHSKSGAQVLLRWGLQHGLIEIPKSSNPGRIRENAAIFDFRLSDEEMAALDQCDEGLRTSWDPSDQA